MHLTQRSISMNKILEIKGLSVSYKVHDGIRKVLRNVTMELEQGEIMAIVGESGCGKSTLVNTIISLLPENAEVTSGEILVDDIRIGTVSEKKFRGDRNRLFGVVFQDPFSALDPMYKIVNQARETLEIRGKVRKSEADEKIARTLRECGIADPAEIMNKYPHELSGGLKQRVMIALALLNDPKLLIADEPTTALDVTIQKEILKLLRQLANERNLAVLFITHSLDVAAEIADRITVFYGGKIVEEGKVDDIFSFPRHPYTQALLKTIPSISYGKNERKLMPIEGELFSFLDDYSGCPFAPRCPYGKAHCFAREPELRGQEGHKYACLNEVLL